MTLSAAVERIVVQATAQDKKTIAAKARRLAMPVSELMRRGAFAYETPAADSDMLALAGAAQGAAERAGAAIDDALAFIAASNARLVAMERAAARPAASVRARASARARKAA